jgi:transcriptional regulator with XRE-family HTH domain
MNELHPYTKKLRDEMVRLHLSVRGQTGRRRGIAEDAHLAPSRVEEIVAGERPTEDEHRKLCRAMPSMKYMSQAHLDWLRAPESTRPAPPDPKAKVEPPPPVMPRPTLPPTPPEPLMLVPRTFGEHLRAAREREGWSPDDLAQLLDVSPSAVRSWENEVNVPVAENYSRILDALPILTGPDIPRPEVRDIPQPRGRVVPGAAPEVVPPPAKLAARAPLIAFGMALARLGPSLKSTRAAVVGLLRDGASAGLSCEEIATAIEEAEG